MQCCFELRMLGAGCNGATLCRYKHETAVQPDGMLESKHTQGAVVVYRVLQGRRGWRGLSLNPDMQNNLPYNRTKAIRHLAE